LPLSAFGRGEVTGIVPSGKYANEASLVGLCNRFDCRYDSATCDD